MHSEHRRRVSRVFAFFVFRGNALSSESYRQSGLPNLAQALSSFFFFFFGGGGREEGLSTPLWGGSIKCPNSNCRQKQVIPSQFSLARNPRFRFCGGYTPCLGFGFQGGTRGESPCKTHVKPMDNHGTPMEHPRKNAWKTHGKPMGFPMD